MEQSIYNNIYFEEECKKKIVNIYDIDGCILPSKFPNLYESINPIEIKRKGASLKPYPNFIKYYHNVASNTLKSIFITGRKRSEFRDLTNFQLYPIICFDNYTYPIYYPEYLDHNEKQYYNFRIGILIDLIETLVHKYQDLAIRIFDDDPSYFDQLFEIIANKGDPKYRLTLYHIQSNEDWVRISDHIYSIIGDEKVEV